MSGLEAVQRAEAERREDRQQDPRRRLTAASDEIRQRRGTHDRRAPCRRRVAADSNVGDAPARDVEGRFVVLSRRSNQRARIRAQLVSGIRYTGKDDIFPADAPIRVNEIADYDRRVGWKRSPVISSPVKDGQTTCARARSSRGAFQTQRQRSTIGLHEEVLRHKAGLAVLPIARACRRPPGGVHNLKGRNLGDVEHVVDAEPIATDVNAREVIYREVAEGMCGGISHRRER